ncbi:MAG: hypothetical protein AABX69_05385 [Nanoarchaeota archaeon]
MTLAGSSDRLSSPFFLTIVATLPIVVLLGNYAILLSSNSYLHSLAAAATDAVLA